MRNVCLLYTSRRVIGQDEGVELVTEAIIRSKAGIKDPTKPIGSFLILGPTDVYKRQTLHLLFKCFCISQIFFTENPFKNRFCKLIQTFL